jgi:hypothetical protein
MIRCRDALPPPCRPRTLTCTTLESDSWPCCSLPGSPQALGDHGAMDRLPSQYRHAAPFPYLPAERFVTRRLAVHRPGRLPGDAAERNAKVGRFHASRLPS